VGGSHRCCHHHHHLLLLLLLRHYSLLSLSFPYKRYSFCSVQSSYSPFFHTHIPQSQPNIIHLNLGLFSPHLLVFLPVTSLVSFYHLFLHHAQGIPNLHCNYSYNVGRFKFIKHFLINIYFPVTHFCMLAQILFSKFSFPT